MERLKNKHTGEPCWIIGKGPSLHNLTSDQIGVGVVIAINQSIRKIEELDIPNVTYAMFKDGGNKRQYQYDNLTPECFFRGKCSEDFCGFVVPKKGASLLVHDLESKYCCEEYKPRYVFKLSDLELTENVYSLIAATKIAGLMGCASFNFVCCDAHAIGDAQDDIYYKVQVATFGNYINHLQHNFTTGGEYEN